MTTGWWVACAALVLALYVALVALLGFEGLVGLSINFGRVALATAVLIIYVPALSEIFQEVPAPRRDYLLAGIILTWASAICFAVWNEAGRVFGVETSIFRSPIAGFFSLLLVFGGVFHMIAPDTARQPQRIIALVIGIIVSVAIVFIAPLFR